MSLYKRRTKKLPPHIDVYDMHYVPPKKRELAVGIVYFNAAKSKRMLMNYMYAVEKLKLADIPYYTIEMYVTTPEIKDAIHVKTDFILFQKERLCRVLETYIPKTFTKLLFIDCDIIFDNPNWYNELSHELDKCEIVQPFTHAKWLDITYKKTYRTKKSIVLTQPPQKTPRQVFGKYHPGFAWAFQRDWYNRFGFYEYDVLGNSDSISCNIWFPTIKEPWHYPPYTKNTVEEYKLKLTLTPTICFLDGNIYHLFHGYRRKRKYSTRWKIFKSVKDIRDILTIDKNGLFALKDDTYKPLIKRYFNARDDDGTSD